MHRLLAALAFLLVTPVRLRPRTTRTSILKNDKLKVKVYLPDAEKGFYRGTRFDWAGVFGEIEFAGHKIFGPWKDTHDPTNHDDIIGPCEEFGIDKPLGYDDAKVGRDVPEDRRRRAGEAEGGEVQLREEVQDRESRRSGSGSRSRRTSSARRNLKSRGSMKASHASGYGYEYVKSLRIHPESGGVTHRPPADEHRHEADRDRLLQPQLLQRRRRPGRAELLVHVPVRREGRRTCAASSANWSR